MNTISQVRHMQVRATQACNHQGAEQTPDTSVRQHLVQRIRTQISDGTYADQARLDQALDRMIDQTL